MEAIQVKRQCFGFGRTSTFLQLTMPPSDGAVRCDTGPTTSRAFGRFQVLPHRRELLADGQPIQLGGRAFDVLIALIDARGAVVTKDALMAHIWPDRIVEENALQSQISALRMALGADRDLVRTVSGRGYQFIGEASPVPSAGDNAGADAVATKPASAVPMTNLPEPLSELIGRDDEIGEILNLATAHRLVTLTGAGGIGKTRLALALARRVLSQFTDGVWVAELAPISDPALVPAALAEVAGIELTTAVCSAEHVANALSGKQLLFVLDNCEHVIDAAAAMSEALLRANPAAHVITTSREPLNVEGEWVYPVPSLAVPLAATECERDPSQYGAIRLFFETAKAAAPGFNPDRRDTAAIVTICRRLGGLPLAIELAASRAAMLGIDEVAAQLDDPLRVLGGGRRTAPPRHRSLRATLDWSYALLGERERLILRRLSIFRDRFTLEAATSAIADAEITTSDFVAGLAELVMKSLVGTQDHRGRRLYAMLDTTRAYALEKLSESSERERIARLHADSITRICGSG
jgi:predicted ATPase/DNA-binding winged helix-turn-helix (wHTH) protein